MSQDIPWLWHHIHLWQIRHRSFKCLLGFHAWNGTLPDLWCDNCPMESDGKKTWIAPFGGK